MSASPAPPSAGGKPCSNEDCNAQHSELPVPQPEAKRDMLTALRDKDMGLIRELFQEQGPDILSKRDQNNFTPAHWAAHYDFVEGLKFLFENGASVDDSSNDAVNMHPIHWACAAGSLNALHFLVTVAGVDVNRPDATKHRTPLLVAAQYGFPLLVIYLVKQGAKVLIADDDGDTALHWAAYKGNEQVVAIFQYLGLRVDAPDNFGQTPLHLAAMRGNLETVQYLVEEVDCNLYSLDGKGRTPQQLASLAKRRSAARYLSKKMRLERWNPLLWCEATRIPYVVVWIETILAYVWLFYTYGSEKKQYLGGALESEDETAFILFFHSRSFYSMAVFSSIGMLWFLLKTHYTSPGYLKNVAEFHNDYENVVLQLAASSTISDVSLLSNIDVSRPLCHTCHIQRPHRSKHCRVCKQCVSVFDHHCPYMDNCVGEQNYSYFFGYLFFALLGLSQLLYVIYEYLVETGWAWSMIALGVNFGIFFLFVANMIGMHIYLSAQGITTNESINYQRYGYLQQRDRKRLSMIANFSSRLFPKRKHRAE